VTNPWIIYPKPNPQASLRLFCFPYAGAGASIFRTWHSFMTPEIEVCSLQLPGRETRIKEPLFTDLVECECLTACGINEIISANLTSRFSD